MEKLIHSANYIEFLHPGSSLIFCLLIFFVGGLIFAWRPMLAMAFICIQPYFLWAVSINVGIHLYLAYLAVAIILVRYVGRIFQRPKPYYGPILIFAIILVFWSIVSPLVYPIRHGVFTGYSLSRVNLVGSLIPMLLIPLILRSKEDVVLFIKNFIGLLAVLIGVFFVCCLMLLATGRSLNLLPFTNILGVMPYFWESALLIISLSFVCVIGWMPVYRVIPLAIIAIFCLLIADSRTKTVAAFVCSGYLVLPYLRRSILPLFSVTIVLILSFLLLPGNFTSQAWKIVQKRVEQTTSDDVDMVQRTSGRSLLFSWAFDAFLSSPIIGVGEGYQIPPGWHGRVKVRQSTHNYYIGVLAGQGVIGAGILVLVLVLTFRVIVRLRYVARNSPEEAIISRFIIAVVVYGLLCMLFKASWGSTFWSLALLQVYFSLLKIKITRNNAMPVIK